MPNRFSITILPISNKKITAFITLSGSFSPRLRQDFALTGAKVRPNWGENEGFIFLFYHVYNSVFAREYPAEIPFTLHFFIIRI